MKLILAIVILVMIVSFASCGGGGDGGLPGPSAGGTPPFGGHSGPSSGGTPPFGGSGSSHVITSGKPREAESVTFVYDERGNRLAVVTSFTTSEEDEE